MAGRVLDEMEALRGRYGTGWVALVTHADVIRTAFAHLAGIPLDLALRLEVHPACASVVALEDGGPRVLRVNESFSEPWTSRR